MTYEAELFTALVAFILACHAHALTNIMPMIMTRRIMTMATTPRPSNRRAAGLMTIATPRPCPWTPLETPQDVELWIEEHNRSLQALIRPNETGFGVCFQLREGGALYLQTGSDGSVVLDVDAEADWVTPLIAAATGAPAPKGALWVLPDYVLVQLILGLSSLVESTILVAGHHFGARRRRAL